MKTIPSILFLLLCCLHPAYSQLVIDSTRFITGYNCCTSITYSIPTADKGILFVGSDMENPGGIIPYFPTDTSINGNVMIGKIDSNHQISWIKVFGGSQDDGGNSVCQTPDGGYAVLAYTESSDGDVTGYLGGGDMWLLRLDVSGNLLWEKCYGSSAQDIPMSIANTPDHGFILSGTTDGSDNEVPLHYGAFYSFDWLVIKTDSMGNFLWGKDLGGTEQEGSTGSILAIDSSYYLISWSNSADHDCTDTSWHAGLTFINGNYYIIKLDDAGKVIWDSSYGGSGGDYANYAMYDTRDSTIVITGSTSSGDYMVTDFHGWQDMWIIKVNRNGTLIFEKTLGGTDQEGGTSICTFLNGGYLAYGSRYPGTIGGGLDLYLLNNTGNEISNKYFGGSNGDYPSSIISGINGITATGNSYSFAFTEGSTYGNFDTSTANPQGGGAFVSYIDSVALGVNNLYNSFSNTITIFPNPTQNIANVFIANHGAGVLNVVNCIGQAVYVKEIKQQTSYIEVNTSVWNEGVYLIKWQGVDGNILTKKLIKN